MRAHRERRAPRVGQADEGFGREQPLALHFDAGEETAQRLGMEGGVGVAPAADELEARPDPRRAYLAAALRAHGGNVSRAAAGLGIHRQSLQQKLRKLRLPAELFRAT